MRTKVILACDECLSRNYSTVKNKRFKPSFFLIRILRIYYSITTFLCIDKTLTKNRTFLSLEKKVKLF